MQQLGLEPEIAQIKVSVPQLKSVSRKPDFEGFVNLATLNVEQIVDLLVIQNADRNRRENA